MRAREIVLPGDEKEAVAMCMALGVPDDFVKELFFNLAGKSFKDGAGVQVTDFVRYVQGRMMKKKNAFDKPATAPASGSDPAWVVEKKRAARLTELDALIDGHCANPRGTAFTRERTPDMRADFEKLWAERKRLRGSNGK